MEDSRISFPDSQFDNIMDIYISETIAPSESASDVVDERGGVFTEMDKFVTIFFFLAAGWLLLAMMYSLFILYVLKLQSRGQLDIYDENFGHLSFCGGRLNLNCACILRRYAVRLELQNGEAHRRVHIMTREERRAAMEKLLVASTKKKSKVDDLLRKNNSSCCDDGEKECLEEDEGPLCTICLAGYEHDDHIIGSGNCAHVFHKDCIMDWLERRDNTECPVCRRPMVSDAEVVKRVEEMRKEQNQLLRQQRQTFFRRILWWKRNESNQEDEEVSRDLEVGQEEISEDTASDSTSTASS